MARYREAKWSKPLLSRWLSLRIRTHLHQGLRDGLRYTILRLSAAASRRQYWRVILRGRFLREPAVLSDADQTAILRCIFGPLPFRPIAFDSIWLTTTVEASCCKPSMKKKPSTECRFSVTLWKKRVVPTPKFWPIAVGLVRMFGAAGLWIWCLARSNRS